MKGKDRPVSKRLRVSVSVFFLVSQPSKECGHKEEQEIDSAFNLTCLVARATHERASW